MCEWGGILGIHVGDATLRQEMIRLKDKRVLVTGAAGFIPSHLCEALVAEGARVRAFVHYDSRPSLGNLEYLPQEVAESLEVVSGDVQDPFFVRRAVEGCEVVFHLAALIGIPYSYAAPEAYVRTNTNGTLNVLQACRDAQTPRLVHTSTSETYGTARYVPIDESHPLQAQSPYSASKIAADKLAESYFLSFDLPVVTVRPFNTYGPRQSARAVIPTIAGQLLAGDDELRLGSLEPVRDLTYVTDTVRGFVLAATTEGVEGRVLNLGTGRGVTVNELATALMRIVGREIPIKTDPERVRPEGSEVLRLISSAESARKDLGWEPEIALEEGLNRVVEFLRRHPDHLRPGRYTL
ncbi:MAG: SDR family NAD(P)-dependent oxidoreductase [bacterium]